MASRALSFLAALAVFLVPLLMVFAVILIVSSSFARAEDGSPPPKPEPDSCHTHAELSKTLIGFFKAQQAWVGLSHKNTGIAFEIWANPTSWVLLRTAADGMSCIVDGGQTHGFLGNDTPTPTVIERRS